MSNNQTIKNLRVKNSETSVSQVLPIGADAVNVELANRRNLQETIGNIDSRTDGSITNNLEVLSSAIQTLDNIKADTAMIGSPLVAGTASEMTDTSHIYVYTGSESGYTNGNWYYYDGTIWASGGVYNSAAVETDKTLKVENVPADSRATGNIVLVSETQPTAASNRIWIDPDVSEIEIPTMDDLNLKVNSPLNNGVVDNGVSGQVLSTNGNGTTDWINPLSIDNTLSQAGKAADSKTTGDEITALKDDLTCSVDEMSTYEDTYGILLNRGGFERDVYNPSTNTVNTYQYRISSRIAMRFPYAIKLTAKTGFRFYCYVYNDSLGTYSTTGWKTTYDFEAGRKFYIQIGRATEDISEVANVPEFLSAITVIGNPLYKFMTEVAPVIKQDIRWEQGGYTASDGYLVKSTATDRIRTQFFTCQQNIRIFFKSTAVKVVAFFVNPDGTYKGAQQQIPTIANTAGNISNAYVGANYKDYTFALAVVKEGSTITPSEVSNYVDIVFQNDDYVQNGKQVLIYKFGGGGNDWCFVRTPENYNQFRVKPYPFVICNHGNGWVMNGTPQTANWTKRTMYVPLDDPDYIANPDQYNGTSDETLWYSNPTIEALLTAGYVVCGCENYGDLLYGNNNCRNACADFFFHMINRYNVEDRCYMIGASNGALTSLNASYLLPGRIKAMILQYPITCLVNQYSSNSSQQAGIRSAYGITDADISLADLAVAVATHDPLTTDVVDSKKIGSIPPVKLWYSQSDTAVNYQQNTIAFANLLEASNKVVETVQASGQHGDYSHFDPTAYVAWFNAN